MPIFSRKLVKNYSCGRLCDYEDFESVSIIKKFGSTPLFNIPTTNSAATMDRQTGGQPPAAPAITATAGFRGKPKLSKSFTNNLYEKTYRKPSFTPSPFNIVGGGGSIAGLGYSVPVTKSQQSLGGGGLAVNGGPPTENYYAATDLLQV